MPQETIYDEYELELEEDFSYPYKREFGDSPFDLAPTSNELLWFPWAMIITAIGWVLVAMFLA